VVVEAEAATPTRMMVETEALAAVAAMVERQEQG
jgi:hypothetical protein